MLCVSCFKKHVHFLETCWNLNSGKLNFHVQVKKFDLQFIQGSLRRRRKKKDIKNLVEVES